SSSSSDFRQGAGSDCRASNNNTNNNNSMESEAIADKPLAMCCLASPDRPVGSPWPGRTPSTGDGLLGLSAAELGDSLDLLASSSASSQLSTPLRPDAMLPGSYAEFSSPEGPEAEEAECSCCGRSFRRDRLSVHAQICRRAAATAGRRHVFESKRQRLRELG
ncbi:unnamed protein product, partial [Polarella glacialis]